jgi:hypothetical protein
MTISVQPAQTILDLIRRDRGQQDEEQFSKFRISDTQPFTDTACEFLAHTPAIFGRCAPMSAAWAALLRDHHGIPAVVVAGDLMLERCPAFVCDRNIPAPSKAATEMENWDGHCWIEVDGRVGDISVFRTARVIDRPSVLKDFIERHFGLHRGMMLVERSALDAIQMDYVPKYVLTEAQITGLILGMRHEIQLLMGTSRKRAD